MSLTRHDKYRQREAAAQALPARADVLVAPRVAFGRGAPP
jgi:hypothetical protein